MDNRLFVSIQKTSKTPMYRQIAEHIRRLADSGELPDGTRLPPIRKLAQLLSVNTVTVVKAYELLRSESIIYSIRGSGMYIGDSVRPEEPVSDEVYGEADRDLLQVEVPRDVINFSTSTPESNLFPIQGFRDSLNFVLDRDGGNAFEYDQISGYLPLRKKICEQLSQSYGIQAETRNLQVISGAQQGIDIAAKALVKPGNFVLVEDPTYAGALAVFRSRGAKISGIPMDSKGMIPGLLEKRIREFKPTLLYCMPDYQNPTSISTSILRRKLMLELAGEYNFWILEDDYVSDLRYSAEQRIPSIKSLEAPKDQRVIYIKSFSKLLMPGLRIGFMLSPDSLHRKLLQAKHMTDISSSGLIQRAFEQYLKSPSWKDHIAWITKEYRQRYDAMYEEIRSLAEYGVRTAPPGGGLHFWLELPPDIPASQLYRQAASSGVLVTPGWVFSAANADETHIRISIASASIEDIRRGVKILREAIAEMRSGCQVHPMM